MSALALIKDRLKEHEDEIEEVEEMDLSELKIGQFTPEIAKHLEKFKNVKVIILQNCGLDSLDNLPKWDLYVMDLSDNKYPPPYPGSPTTASRASPPSRSSTSSSWPTTPSKASSP